MPRYDYHCEVNQQVVEVKHTMDEEIQTWGELCERAGLSLGDTPASTPVRRLITGGHVVRNSSLGSTPPCQAGAPCCGQAVCGLD
jgi:hypothetical protein